MRPCRPRRRRSSYAPRSRPPEHPFGVLAPDHGYEYPVRTRHRQAAQPPRLHPLDGPVELEARPHGARPRPRRLLDGHAVTREGRASEPSENDTAPIGDEAGVPSRVAYVLADLALSADAKKLRCDLATGAPQCGQTIAGSSKTRISSSHCPQFSQTLSIRQVAVRVDESGSG